jgi:hypothetical protein
MKIQGIFPHRVIMPVLSFNAFRTSEPQLDEWCECGRGLLVEVDCGEFQVLACSCKVRDE